MNHDTENDMDNKKSENTVETKDAVKPGRIKVRKLPDRPLGLIQGN